MDVEQVISSNCGNTGAFERGKSKESFTPMDLQRYQEKNEQAI